VQQVRTVGNGSLDVGGTMSGNNGCPNDVNDFERGYDQAVQEVLDAVAEHDVSLARALTLKYPVWSQVWTHARPDSKNRR
jgi:hypothetical protein